MLNVLVTGVHELGEQIVKCNGDGLFFARWKIGQANKEKELPCQLAAGQGLHN